MHQRAAGVSDALTESDFDEVRVLLRFLKEVGVNQKGEDILKVIEMHTHVLSHNL